VQATRPARTVDGIPDLSVVPRLYDCTGPDTDRIEWVDACADPGIPKGANAGLVTLRRRLHLTETLVSGDKAVRPKRTLSCLTDIN
jgi:hypothetical protein